jgi:CheY-like chemotaxis protein
MQSTHDFRDERKRVLLVDDDNSVRDCVYTLLESVGYEVLSANNGLDGLTIFHRSLRPVDLVVTDCDMPGMTGLELSRACARRDRNVLVLYMSGTDPDEELRADLETSGRAFLPKPFRADELLRKAKKLMAAGYARANVPVGQTLQPGVQMAR